jgi:hypothetical protein
VFGVRDKACGNRRVMPEGPRPAGAIERQAETNRGSYRLYRGVAAMVVVVGRPALPCTSVERPP